MVYSQCVPLNSNKSTGFHIPPGVISHIKLALDSYLILVCMYKHLHPTRVNTVMFRWNFQPTNRLLILSILFSGPSMIA